MTVQSEIRNYVLAKCGSHFLKNKGVYSAHITLCGYDYFETSPIESEAKRKLASDLSTDKHIQNKFSLHPPTKK